MDLEVAVVVEEVPLIEVEDVVEDEAEDVEEAEEEAAADEVAEEAAEEGEFSLCVNLCYLYLIY